MTPWNERPTEVANLFNPAFCAFLLKTTLSSYYKKKGEGMNFSLIFLILPILLHNSTRSLLPNTTRTKVHTWLQNNQEVRVGFDKRIVSLSKYTKESLIFGIQHNIITINEDGLFINTKRRLTKYEIESIEATQCVEKANFIGKWFAEIADVSTLLMMWGIEF